MESYYSYIGAYIKIYNPELDSVEKYNSCTNNKCRNHKKRLLNRFCSKCGQELDLISIKTKSRIKVDLDEVFPDETLTHIPGNFNGNYLYLIANIDNLSLGITIDVDNVEHEILNDKSKSNLPSREFLLLKTNFSTEIKQLKSIFGSSNVEVVWGIINYSI